MALALRLTLTGPPAEDPEDFFGSSLAMFDDVMNLHGDAEHGLLYHSPHLPKPLQISLADPEGEDDRKLFSHYLWNASLLLAEFVEAGTIIKTQQQQSEEGCNTINTINTSTNSSSSSNTNKKIPDLTSPLGPDLASFDVRNLTTIELGAGTALPSLLAALLGAKRVVMTDYPSPAIVSNLRANAERNIKPEYSIATTTTTKVEVEVEGHAWGELTPSSSPLLAERNHHAFDRVLVCDCLWMPWQHDSLLASIDWFLKTDDETARCWVVAGFHTGRGGMRVFFETERLARVGLEVERIWERDCDGVEREWSWDRGIEDPGERKRWLAFAVLKRKVGGNV